MSNQYAVKGFVDKINEKTGNNARGPWTAYSIKVQDAETGEVNPLWFQFGFKRPGFSEGDYIEFQAEPKNDKAAQFVEGTGKKPKNAPAKPAAPEKPAGRKGGGGFKKDPKVQKQINYQNARGGSLALIALLLENDALPMSAAKTKAGQAKRYEEIVAMIDKTTVRFFNDTESLRLLESVADEGVVDLGAKDALPDQMDPADTPAAEDPPTQGDFEDEDDDGSF